MPVAARPWTIFRMKSKETQSTSRISPFNARIAHRRVGLENKE